MQAASGSVNARAGPKGRLRPDPRCVHSLRGGNIRARFGSEGLFMSEFIIRPHGRLQDWVADEQGYFRDEGLIYQLVGD